MTDFWRKYRNEEDTLDFASLGLNSYSIGQVFKLPESAIRKRLESIEESTGGAFEFDDSAAIPRVVRVDGLPDPKLLLRTVYQRGFE